MGDREPWRREDVVAVGIAVEAVAVAEEEADGEVGGFRLGGYGDVAVEAIVDVGGFEEEMDEAIE